MIQKIINDGKYEFRGTLEDFKKCIGSFKITKEIRMGKILDIEMCDVEGKFRYHGVGYKISIHKHWTEDILFIEYRGEIHEA